jgi:HSP20 family protein
MSMQSLFYDFGDLRQPFRAFDLLTREMSRQFDREPRAAARPASAAPEFEAWEKDDAFYLTASLPGVAKEDLSVTVEKNTVTISAKRELPALPGYELRARERRAFAFDRSFEVPSGIAADKAEATLENGILTVTLPKAPEKKAHKIEIKSA